MTNLSIPSKLKKRLRWFAAVAMVALVFALLGGCAPVASRVLLFPQAPVTSVAPAERVMIANADGDIETVRYRNMREQKPVEAIVLRFYGNADQASYQVANEARELQPWSVEIWGVNYPGFGHSGGSASLAGVVRAAEIAYREAQKRALPIYVIGTSMGTTAALYLTAHREIAGAFLINPPPLREIILGDYGWWNLWLLAGPISWGIPHDLGSTRNAARTYCPVVLMTSEKDSLVPPPYQDAIFEAIAGPKVRVIAKGVGHNDAPPLAAKEEALQALRAQGWRSREARTTE